MAKIPIQRDRQLLVKKTHEEFLREFSFKKAKVTLLVVGAAWIGWILYLTFPLEVEAICTFDSLDHKKPFELISRGQLWRLITPVFIHFDFMHWFADAIWFLFIGCQIERLYGRAFLVALIIALSLGSNIVQYLFAGPAFFGISGVSVGLIAFIWSQQRTNPNGIFFPSLEKWLFIIGSCISFLNSFGVRYTPIFLWNDLSHKLFPTLNIVSFKIAHAIHISAFALGWLLGRKEWKRILQDTIH